MHVTVEFFGPAREAAGAARLAIDCDMTCTAQGVVARLAAERGGRLARLLLDNGRLAPSLLVAVNDQEVAGPATLNEGDEITVIPPVSGGAC
jgi:molybdopterin converting factor small subunit